MCACVPVLVCACLCVRVCVYYEVYLYLSHSFMLSPFFYFAVLLFPCFVSSWRNTPFAAGGGCSSGGVVLPVQGQRRPKDHGPPGKRGGSSPRRPHGLLSVTGGRPHQHKMMRTPSITHNTRTQLKNPYVALQTTSSANTANYTTHTTIRTDRRFENTPGGKELTRLFSLIK